MSRFGPLPYYQSSMTAQRSALLLALLSACTAATPENEFRAPVADLITVFFPIYDGTVYGRGLPGAMPDSALPLVRIDSALSNTTEIAQVRADGSFDFDLLAAADDTLEIRGISDTSKTALVGPSTFYKVPRTRFNAEEFTCCIRAQATDGYCESETDREDRLLNNRDCPEAFSGISQPCTTDNDCGVLETERVLIDRARITVTPPNESGQVEVSGTVSINALVTLENRQLNGVGIRSRVVRTARISSDDGTFRFPNVTAQGDDELVLQVHLLSGYKSAPTSFKVPDAEMIGVDVLGAEAWEGASVLRNGYRGTIALYIAPYGKDNRGICPDSTGGPATCYTGGLTHDMVEFITEGEEPTIDDVAATPRVTTPVPSQPGLEYNRGWDGDVRAPSQDLVVVLDMSGAAAAADMTGSRFNQVRTLIQELRGRDRVGVVLFGGDRANGYGGSVSWDDPTAGGNAKEAVIGLRWLGVPEAEVGRSGLGLRAKDERQILLDELMALNDMHAVDNGADLADGLRSAVDMLKQGNSVNGRIAVIAATRQDSQDAKRDPTLGIYDNDHIDELIGLTQAIPRLGQAGVPITLIDINPAEPANDRIAGEVVAFSGSPGSGTTTEVNIENLESALEELQRKIAGSFILLYDMCVPKKVGKRGALEFRLRVRLPFEDPSTGPRQVTFVSPPLGEKPYNFTIKVDGSDGGCRAGDPNCETETCDE